MHKIWLTYAWKDNHDDDVDHIVAELRKKGLDVRFDRVELLAGRRLWEQISAGISDSDISAWAIYTTENSLKSEPCQEELAYALDRALRTRGSKFPLIGLFAGEFDSSLVPSALATRLCVNLHNNDWAQEVVDGAIGQKSESTQTPSPYGIKLHEIPDGSFMLEVWPRTGTWAPVLAAVPLEEKDCFKALVHMPKGVMGGISMVSARETEINGYFARIIDNSVNSTNTARICLSKLPSKVNFGVLGGAIYTASFN